MGGENCSTKFSDIDLVKSPRKFYSTFYGYQLTEMRRSASSMVQGPQLTKPKLLIRQLTRLAVAHLATG